MKSGQSFDYDLALQEGHECLDINYQTILPIAVNKFLIVRVTQINTLGTINVENILVIGLWEPTVWLTLTSISCYGARLAKATLYHGTKVHKTGTQLHDTRSRWSTHSVFIRAGFSTQAGRQWRQQYQEGSAKIRIQKKTINGLTHSKARRKNCWYLGKDAIDKLATKLGRETE